MDELHRRLIRIGLNALADDFGYALGLSTTEAAALRTRFAVWQRQLTTPEDETPGGK